MKILLLEDHSFFASELIDYFNEDTDYELVYAKTYKEAIQALEKHKKFDYSILDVILQNGKTGIDVVKSHKKDLGNIMFLTGCSDSATLTALKDFIVVSKLEVIWPKLDDFFSGKLKPVSETDQLVIMK
jgi:DNA-binding NarL/FixJ family response regulator